MALRLDPGDDFVLNTHLQPSGKPETIEPRLGLYFTGEPATKFPMLLELQNDLALDIPPGAAHFTVNDEFAVSADVDLLAIYPHAHYLGKELRASAALPDGTSETLIFIPRWDLNWQAVFYYLEPVFLPKGTVVSMQYVYDNSEANPANPFHPPQHIQGGNRTTDEMAHLWLQVLPRGTQPQQEEARRSPRHCPESGRFCGAVQSGGHAAGARRGFRSVASLPRRGSLAARRRHREQCFGRRVARRRTTR